MNKFINDPDRLGSLAGLFFWLFAFAGGAAIFLATIVRIAGFVR